MKAREVANARPKMHPSQENPENDASFLWPTAISTGSEDSRRTVGSGCRGGRECTAQGRLGSNSEKDRALWMWANSRTMAAKSSAFRMWS